VTTTTSAPEVDPVGLAAAIRDVALDYLRQGNAAMAIRELQRAQLKNPDDPLTYLGLAAAYRSKGLLPEAESHVLRSLELGTDPQAPDYQLAVLTLATIYVQQERYEEARVQCQILIDDPTYSVPWVALTTRGWAEFKAGQFENARSSYLEALDYRTGYERAHFNLGILDQSQKRWLDAVRRLETATLSDRMSPEALAEAHFRMGEIYMTLGRPDKAIEHFGVAAEEAPEGKWGLQSRSYLELLL
jgi:tetratricopeptide (TPR) repeat protein